MTVPDGRPPSVFVPGAVAGRSGAPIQAGPPPDAEVVRRAVRRLFRVPLGWLLFAVLSAVAVPVGQQLRTHYDLQPPPGGRVEHGVVQTITPYGTADIATVDIDGTTVQVVAYPGATSGDRVTVAFDETGRPVESSEPGGVGKAVAELMAFGGIAAFAVAAGAIAPGNVWAGCHTPITATFRVQHKRDAALFELGPVWLPVGQAKPRAGLASDGSPIRLLAVP